MKQEIANKLQNCETLREYADLVNPMKGKTVDIGDWIMILGGYMVKIIEKLNVQPKIYQSNPTDTVTYNSK
jgi:hypothetical protein